MKTRTRLWLLAGLSLVALIAVGLVLQGINTLYLQLSWYLPYWIVQPVFLLIFAAGALLLVQLAWPWLRSAWKARGRPAAGAERPAPTNRRQAAAQNLAGIDQTLERVRDAVEREALQQERKRMAAELERGDLVIVLFGVGSAGKTSLIRALLQELVGQVGAAMGSTVQSQRYRLRLKGLQRGVWLVDTPGILEAGAAGLEREILAREQASKADLLLLVVDGDLRAAELEVFDALASLGKRLMLVLNKCDLRGEQEEARLLQLLRQRSRGRVAAEDVVAASAAPQSVPMPGGRPLQPAPEVDAVLPRRAQQGGEIPGLIEVHVEETIEFDLGKRPGKLRRHGGAAMGEHTARMPHAVDTVIRVPFAARNDVHRSTGGRTPRVQIADREIIALAKEDPTQELNDGGFS